MLFDVFFLILSLVFGIVGTFFRLQISKFCICFFFIKFYFAVCVYSLFKNYRGKISDEISIHSAANQQNLLSTRDEDEGGDVEDLSPSRRNPGLGEAPLAVAV